MKSLELNLKDSRRTTITIILAVYLIYLFIFTLRPYEFSLDRSLSLNTIYHSAYEALFTQPIYVIRDLVENILIFIPFGFLVFALVEFLAKRRTINIAITAFSGTVLSFIIEFCQLFLPRSPSALDIFGNTVGAIAGAVIATFCYATVARVSQRTWSNIKKSQSLLTAIIVYGALLFAFSNFPFLHPPNLSNWDPSFTFQLGNEGTQDRPWLGKICLVAIYKSVLTPEEIVSNFKAGPFHDASQISTQDNLVAFYNFDEGSGNTIHDTSPGDLPLDITIYDSSRIRWLTPSGIELLEGTIIKSEKPYNKIFLSLYTSNKLSIEVWIEPANLIQAGPARIISLSRDPHFRNFTLGQEGKNVHFRLRTPVTGLNGTHISLQTKDRPLRMAIQHLVATYRNGVEKLYINGIDHETTLLVSGYDLLNLVGSGLVGKWAYCFLFLFPVGFLSYAILSRNPCRNLKAISLSAIMGFGPLIAIEMFQVVKFPRPFDLGLLSIGLIVVLISIIMSSILNKQIYFA